MQQDMAFCDFNYLNPVFKIIFVIFSKKIYKFMFVDFRKKTVISSHDSNHEIKIYNVVKLVSIIRSCNLFKESRKTVL